MLSGDCSTFGAFLKRRRVIRPPFDCIPTQICINICTAACTGNICIHLHLSVYLYIYIYMYISVCCYKVLRLFFELWSNSLIIITATYHVGV